MYEKNKVILSKKFEKYRDKLKTLSVALAGISALAPSSIKAQKYSNNLFDSNIIAKMIRNNNYSQAFDYLKINSEQEGQPRYIIYDIKNRDEESLNRFDGIRDDLAELGETKELIEKVESYKKIKAALEGKMYESAILEEGDLTKTIERLKEEKIISTNKIVITPKNLSNIRANEVVLGNFIIEDKTIHLNEYEYDKDEFYAAFKEKKATEEIIEECFKELDDFIEMVNELSTLTAIHEITHGLHDDKGYLDYVAEIKEGVEVGQVSITDYDKLSQLDEIFTRVSEISLYRDEYIKGSDVFQDLVTDGDSLIYFYRKAIENGEVDPFSKDPKEQEIDKQLMVDIAVSVWNNEVKENYTVQISEQVDTYIKMGKKRWVDTDGNATIAKESNPLVLNSKIQNLMTFYYNGKEENFSKFMDFGKLTHYSGTKNQEKFFYDAVPSLEDEHFENKKNIRTKETLQKLEYLRNYNGKRSHNLGEINKDFGEVKKNPVRSSQTANFMDFFKNKGRF